MVYLAGPYSHPDPKVVEERYNKHIEYLAKLLQAGLVVFSPIAHWHVVAHNYTLPKTWDFWRTLDLAILARCDSLIVLQLPGWKESVGTTAEIEFAKLNDKPIEYHSLT